MQWLTILFFFTLLGIWVGFALFGFKKRWSAVVSVGGGLLTALSAFELAVTLAPSLIERDAVSKPSVGQVTLLELALGCPVANAEGSAVEFAQTIIPSSVRLTHNELCQHAQEIVARRIAEAREPSGGQAALRAAVDVSFYSVGTFRNKRKKCLGFLIEVSPQNSEANRKYALEGVGNCAGFAIDAKKANIFNPDLRPDGELYGTYVTQNLEFDGGLPHDAFVRGTHTVEEVAQETTPPPKDPAVEPELAQPSRALR